MSDLTKILAENQKEMLKLIAPTAKKQTIITATEETDSESENIPENATSTPNKTKPTATTRKTTPVNSRNSPLTRSMVRLNSYHRFVLIGRWVWCELALGHVTGCSACRKRATN